MILKYSILIFAAFVLGTSLFADEDNSTADGQVVFNAVVVKPLSIAEELSDIDLGASTPGETTDFKAGEKGAYFSIIGHANKMVGFTARMSASNPNVTLTGIMCEYFDGVSWVDVRTISTGVFEDGFKSFDFRLDALGELKLRIYPSKMIVSSKAKAGENASFSVDLKCEYKM